MALSTHARVLGALAAGYLVSLATYARLDEQFRSFVAFGLPTSAGIIYVLLRRVALRDPYAHEADAATDPREAILFRVVAFIIALHVIVLSGLLGAGEIAARGVPVVVGLALVAVGNLLPRTRPNLMVGIRTGRTLADRRVWMRTHRVAGYVTVAFGAVVLLSAMLPYWPRAYVIAASGAAAIVALALYYWSEARV